METKSRWDIFLTKHVLTANALQLTFGITNLQPYI